MKKPGENNIIIGDYPGTPEESLMLIIGVKDNYFKYKMTERERKQILAGLEYIGLLKGRLK